MFRQVSADESGIHFNNTIVETDSQNILSNQYLYNGGGVGIGDFNNDGLQDIYFTGNLVPNKLYLNRGDFHFEDITDRSGTNGAGHWCSGVAVVDINNDGWMDIYVCATFSSNAKLRTHLLYVNQGLDKNGIPVFKEEAAEYGLADTSYTTNAAFFDYDNDGDLDLYLINNKPGPFYQNSFSGGVLNDTLDNPNTDILYENVGSDSLGHPFFRNVSKQAGIRETGYGLGLNICDLNGDGWKDIFVSNDFISSDVLYVNNRNKTFTDRIHQYLKHTSFAAMGNSIEDINNDGLPDIVELDMNPEDNRRKKMMLNANSYNTYQHFDEGNYMYQYTRNTLQLNQGPTLKQGDSIGDPVFSEIAFYSGIAATDWSWTPLLADFDNDGLKDLIITNGFPKDLTDHDFITDRNSGHRNRGKAELLKEIPSLKLNNYAYRNMGSGRFEEISNSWGINEPSFSSGAAFADLDNDGDLDYVVNNINGEAFVFENNVNKPTKINENYLQVLCQGTKGNIKGVGAVFQIYYDKGKTQVYQGSPYKGYLSTVQNAAFFGLGKIGMVDSLVVELCNRKTVLKNVKANQTVSVDLSKNTIPVNGKPLFNRESVFTDASSMLRQPVIDEDYDYIDFNFQHLLPHKLSQYGPALVSGDINADGLDDIIIGGSFMHGETVLLQKPDGSFQKSDFIPPAVWKAKTREDMGMLLFDADNDGDLDLYIASGSTEMPLHSARYQDMLYINDGKGNFLPDSTALPVLLSSKSCVKACDFDRDGDLDLFVGERVEPGFYPRPVSGHIFRNDSKNGKVKFTDVTDQIAPGLKNLGLICDAIFTDFNNDGWFDLIVVGEWMPPTFFTYQNGKFENSTNKSGTQSMTGFWNSITAGDFDNDGKMDYVIGNLGENSYYHPSEKYPVSVYAGFFNRNDIYNAVPSVYLKPSTESANEENLLEYPAHTRDDFLKELNSFRGRFPDYSSYASATMKEILPDSLRENALILRANTTKSFLLKNQGGGSFLPIALPPQAQFSCIYGMVAGDFDQDGNLDLILNGNDYGAEVYSGRNDALNGLFLKGMGNGMFESKSISQSGIFIPGDGKAAIGVRSSDGRYLLTASQHNGALKLFSLRKSPHMISLNPTDASALITLNDGRVRKEEFYYGSSFLSQSGRFFCMPLNCKSVFMTDFAGNRKKIPCY